MQGERRMQGMMEVEFDINEHLTKRSSLIDRALDEMLPPEDEPPLQLHSAMRYAVFPGGKRIRPTLVLDACHAVGGDERLALPAACAIELIHTYSLIHDDLPCMDNDDIRRGKPTCHKVFGESIALLCGDALLTLAFEVLAKEQIKVGVPEDVALEVMRVIANAAGHLGMVGGQVMDMEAQSILANGRQIDLAMLYAIHRRKTGALITASVEVGALLGGANSWQRNALMAYAEEVGLAFQITDDLIDARSALGGELRRFEPNVAIILGMERSVEIATEAIERALKHISQLDERALPLRAIAKLILQRCE